MKKYSNRSATLHENEENGYVQVFIRKEAMVELQNILNNKYNATNNESGLDMENISPGEMTTLCNILANCGILNEATKYS